MAHLLTATRLLLAAPFALAMARGGTHAALLAGVLLALAIATDLLDGVVARRRRTASRAGNAFDHSTDFVFVTSGLAAGAARGAFPWALPVLVAAAFAQYVADSYWIHRALRASRLGRGNGILYFAPLAGDVLARASHEALRPAVTALCWLLVASTLVAMGERALLAIRSGEQLPRGPAQE